MKFGFIYLINIIFIITSNLNAQDNTNNTNTNNNGTSTDLNNTNSSSSSSTSTPTTTLPPPPPTTTTTKPPDNTCAANSSYCNYNGNCSLITDNIKKCTCTDGFIGDKCEYKTCTKEKNQCKNDGKCYENINNSEDTKCQCTNQYQGALCEKTTCIDYCYNDGRCLYNGTTDETKCECLPRFFGKKCEFDKCIQVTNCSAESKCYLYYKNDCQCDCDQNCDKSFCGDNGVCNYVNNRLICKCKLGYSGPTCAIDDCIGYCFNNGTCNRNTTNITCSCSSGFDGSRCEKIYAPIEEPKRSSATRVLTYILVFTLFVCILAVTVYVYKRGGFHYVQEACGNITYRLRNYQRTSNTNSRVPYMQTHDKPGDDAYADPFS